MLVLLPIDGNRGGLHARDKGMYLMLTLSWRFVAHKLRFVDSKEGYNLYLVYLLPS